MGEKIITKINVDETVDVVIVMIHGLYSSGVIYENMKKEFERSVLKDYNIKIKVLKYGKLRALLGRLPLIRSFIRKYVTAELSNLTYMYPKAKTIIMAHSFGTWLTATSIDKEFRRFRANLVIFMGSVVKRRFPWYKYKVDVWNFVGTHDMVVLASKLWGTGWSGKKGFIVKDRKDTRVKQIWTQWKHNDYHKGTNRFIGIIDNYLTKEGLKKE